MHATYARLWLMERKMQTNEALVYVGGFSPTAFNRLVLTYTRNSEDLQVVTKNLRNENENYLYLSWQSVICNLFWQMQCKKEFADNRVGKKEC